MEVSMTAEYPNLMLLDYMFQQHVLRRLDPGERYIPDIDASVFSQTWPNTGGGFAEPGYCYGDAMTKQYTTVLISHNYHLAMVFFGNRPAYVVTHIDNKPKFMEDLRNCSMARKYDAEKIY